ncbi:hypothetical protein [Terrihabitans rhizophilus]|jgi:hypothetical protein|uniref:Uncharacterized protein n=1 Tax=Terrihabitans rhizophilus TaxID=3092662 RepID=A0ABU4RXG2_9HYPH|nr:hypothetical protein [Terrihabitans sp. PJ23]MDX6807601.1 hypothetical protein [Terrihabitans sp. PJ23]
MTSRSVLALVLLSGLIASPSLAQTPPAAPSTVTGPAAPADPAPSPPAATAPAPAPQPTAPQAATPDAATPFSDIKAAPNSADQDSNSADAGLGIPTDILMVRVLGPWAADGGSGFSRAIGKVSAGALQLYVQWISDEGEIIQTQEIEQESETPQLALASVRSETGDEESAVYFDTPQDEQGFRETFVLIVGAPGTARFGPATN